MKKVIVLALFALIGTQVFAASLKISLSGPRSNQRDQVLPGKIYYCIKYPATTKYALEFASPQSITPIPAGSVIRGIYFPIITYGVQTLPKCGKSSTDSTEFSQLCNKSAMSIKNKTLYEINGTASFQSTGGKFTYNVICGFK